MLHLVRTLLVFAAMATVAAAAEKPNVVILFADDMGYGDTEITGHPTIRTPNFNRMSEEGLTLTQFNVAVGSCRPSRTSLLTGRYAARIHPTLYFSGGPCEPIPDREFSLAEGLKEAGYVTAMTGKWHLKPGPEEMGFDHVLDVQRNDNLVRNRTERATEFIREHQDEPFFLYVAYNMPHVELRVSDKFAGSSRRGKYGDVIQELDWSAGQIMDTLNELGIAENTFVIFTSDNGPWLKKDSDGGNSGLLRGGKGQTWEGGVREPTFVWWPGTIEAGKRSMAFCTSMDLYRTVLDLAGVQPPDHLIYDGMPMRDVFVEGTDNDREDMMVYYYIDKTDAPAPEGDDRRWVTIDYEIRAARLGKWKLHFITNETQESDKVYHDTPLLFDLEMDPREKFDVAAEHPEIVKQIQRELDTHVQEREVEIAKFGGIENEPVPN